jgi:hypothetical protein
MKWIALLLICISAASCKQTAVKQKLSGTDSVMVQFFDDKSGMIYNAVTSTEKSAIKKLASFMDSRSVTPMKCGSSGKVQFFSKHRLILDATYINKTDCRYFSYELEGKLQHVAMSNEAADFLKSLTPPK